MTPEEAKPHQIYREEPSGGHGGSRKADYPTPMFTAKETAEIARAYAQACLVCENTCHLGCNHLSNCRNYWREHFKELIK